MNNRLVTEGPVSRHISVTAKRHSRRKPRFRSFVQRLLLISLLVGMMEVSDSRAGDVEPFVIQAVYEEAGTGEEAGASDLALFIGRFHPVFVHLPIGFLLMAFLLEFAAFFKRYRSFSDAVPFVLLAGIITGALSAFTGYLLSETGGYSDDLLSIHKWMGILVLVIAVAAYILRIRKYEIPKYRKLFRVFLVLMVIAVSVAGHYGGSLTHGADYLIRYMPEPFRSWIGVEREEPAEIALIEDLATARIYPDVIEPILAARCQSCHDPDRTEGDLLMTSYEELMQGGESGPVIVAREAGESELYRRLRLPERHDDRMPPRGRTQLTDDQVELIGWWIEQGAPADHLVTDLDTEGEIWEILESMTEAGRSFFERTTIEAAGEELIAEAREAGFRVGPIAAGSPFLQVKPAQSRTSVTRDDMEILLPLSEQITWLDFSSRAIEPEISEYLPEFIHLTRLYLQQTDITDDILAAVANLGHLRYLNLYDTAITDTGLAHLESLEHLEALYLWQTGVSAEGVQALQEKRPALYIDTGTDLEELPKPDVDEEKGGAGE